MTREQAKILLERVASLPTEAQQELVRELDRIEAKHQVPCRVADDEWSAIQEGIAQSDRGEFVSDEDMEALFKQHGL